MYILYLDDSGSIANPREDYFVLGGVAVPESSLRWLSYEVEKLAELLSPRAAHQVEFHASEIFSGRTSIWKGMRDKSQRIKVIKDVLLCLSSANPGIIAFACAVHKASFPNSDPVELAFEELSSRFNMFLGRARQANEKGLIVLDKTSYEQNLQQLARQFRSGGNRWGSYLRNICEVPLFAESRASRILQLADHIAYAVFRRYSAGDLTYYNCIEARFDQDGGKIHGLVHKQTYNQGCTCPACLSRRT
jgi:hypothetical protein